jgi:hypothetical protein
LKATLPSSVGAAGIPIVNLSRPAQAAQVVATIRIGRLIENLAGPLPDANESGNLQNAQVAGLVPAGLPDY